MRAHRVLSALRSAVGLDEVLLVSGLVMITVSLWPIAGRLALLAPGAVITWIVLPTRAPFIVRKIDPESVRKARART